MRIFVLRAARVAAWFLAVLIVALSFVSAGLRPETGAPHDFEHFAIFAATGVAFGLGYSRTPTLTAVALVIFAGAIELTQIIIPGRHARLSDFIVDAAASCVGLALASILAGRALDRAI